MSEFKGMVEVETVRVKKALDTYDDLRSYVKGKLEVALDEFRLNYKPKYWLFSTRDPDKFIKDYWYFSVSQNFILYSCMYLSDSEKEAFLRDIDPSGIIIDTEGWIRYRHTYKYQLEELKSLVSVDSEYITLSPEQALFLGTVEAYTKSAGV